MRLLSEKCIPRRLDLGFDLLLHHLRLVNGELLEPRHGGPQLSDSLREVVAVEVGGAIADPPEEVAGDVYPAVVEIGAVLSVKFLLESF